MRRGQSEKEDILLKRRVKLLRKVRNSQQREGAKGLFAQGCLINLFVQVVSAAVT